MVSMTFFIELVKYSILVFTCNDVMHCLACMPKCSSSSLLVVIYLMTKSNNWIALDGQVAWGGGGGIGGVKRELKRLRGEM